MTMKRWIAMLLCAVMVVGMVPAQAFAVEVGHDHVHGDHQHVQTITESYVNPVFNDVSAVPAAPAAAGEGEVEYQTSIADAAAVVLAQFKARQSTISVGLMADAYTETELHDVMNAALAHNGNADEGDYLHWQYGGWSGTIGGYVQSGTYYLTLTYEVTYYTTAEQEAAVTAAVDALLAELALEGQDDYHKVKGVYDWLCANVLYDFANLNDHSYKLKHTAYAALMDRTAVCQGYAVLLYRLLLELGVDCRLIAGIGNGGAHAWNIIELGGMYYNADATWDAGQTAYSFFLKGDDFGDHTRDAEYLSDGFMAAYPMSGEDYVYSPATVVNSGTCGDGMTWVLDSTGALIISGGRYMYDYTENDPAPWEEYRDEIRFLVVEEGVEQIGYYAFANCHNLTSISLPSSVTTIESNAFYHCTGLTQVDLPAGLTVMGSCVFEGCTRLTGVTIPDTLTEIPSGVFRGCEALTNVEFPTTITGIGTYAFQDCVALTDMVIPEGVTIIDYYAFEGCTGLETVTLPSTLNTLRYYAFYGCTALTAVEIPAGVTEIEDSAFRECTALERVDIAAGIESVGYAAFMNCSSLSQVTIGEGLTSIGEWAFSGTAIRSLVLPDSLTNLDTNAFAYCANLTEIHIPTGMTELKSGVFAGTAISSVTIPENITSFSSGPFTGCASLKEIRFLGDAPSFAANSFYTLTVTVFYPGLNETWTEDVRQNYRGTATWTPWYHTLYQGTCGEDLTWTLDEAGTLTVSGTGAMYDYEAYNELPWRIHHESMREVIVESGVTTLSAYAFYNYNNLLKVTLPEGLTAIGDEAFAWCANLREINIPGTVTEMGINLFLHGNELTTVHLGEGLTVLGEGMFAPCPRLETLSLPQSLTTVCDRAFAGCTALREVIFRGSAPAFGEDVFADVAADVYYSWSASWDEVAQQQYGGVITWHATCAGGLNHSYTNEVVDPTCTEEGYIVHTCSVCGHSYQDTVTEANGHAYEDRVTRPTCVSGGYTTHICWRCSYSYVDSETEPLDHDMGEWYRTLRPYCETAGEERRNCTRCDHYETREVPATGHNYEIVVYEPTCEAGGYTYYWCSNCAHSYTDGETAALGHEMGDWYVREDADCERDGMERRGCIRCGHYETRVVPALGHRYEDRVTEPTCEDGGYTTHTCAECGHSYVDNYTEALGHDMGQWEVLVKASCTQVGQEYACCKRCDFEQTREIPMVDHQWAAASCTESRRCANCGAEDGEPLGHDMTDWYEVVKPTCTDGGQEQRDCRRCGFSEARQTETLGHRYEDRVTEPTCTDGGYTTHTCAECGYSYVDAETEALGHDWVDATCEAPKTCARCDETDGEALGHNYESVVTEATCTDGGYTTHTCANCGHSYVDAETEALGHAWVAATCEAPKICARCDATEGEALGHNYESVVTEATCTDGGYTTHTCANCGHSYVDAETEALGHDWVDATCEAPKTCARCDATEGEALGHNYESVVTETTCTEGGYTTHTCTVCDHSYTDAETEAMGHEYGEWVVVTAPTCTEAGVEQHDCIRCDASETRELPPVDHNYESVVTEATCVSGGYTTHTCAACGHSYVDGETPIDPENHVGEEGTECECGEYLGEAVTLEITNQPENVTVANGETAKVSVEAKGEGLTYQWYYTSNGKTSTFYKSSNTTATYTTTMDATRDGRKVYCVITDKYGNSVKTDVVTLSMASGIIINKQPVNVTVANGETAKVSVEAKGEGLTYQWYYTSNGKTSAFYKSSNTTNTYTTTMDATRDGRKVYCVVTDKYGNSVKTDVVTLSMASGITITKQPENVTVANGETAKVSVEAKGEGLTYQWYYTSNGKTSTFYKSSNTTNTYTTTMDATRDGRKVYCVISDKHGNSVKTDVVTLSMASGITITKQPENVTVATGETAKVSVEAKGEGLTYQWYYTSNGKTSTFYKSSNTTNTYTTTMDAIRDGRKVYCVISDKHGNSVKTDVVTLSMASGITITKQPENVTVANGETAKVSVEAKGEGLTYQWYYTSNGKISTFYKSSNTTATYTTTMDATRDGRKVYCVITDKHGNSVKSDVVTLSMASGITITKQPENVTAANGETAKVSVEAKGESLTYQWYYAKAGSNTFFKSSNTTNTYTTTMTAARNGYRVYCVITDQNGSTVMTDIVTLTMG